jgi:hypothetical protein
MIGGKRIKLAAAAVFLAVAAPAGAISSANYSIPFSTINSGVGPMSSANYALISSLGDGVASATISSASAKLASGFINELYGANFSCILDIDGNGTVDPRTDGLMLVRAMFGLIGTAVTNGALATDAKKTSWAEVQPLIHMTALDIDGNGKTDPLTDGLMLVRAMFGLTGSTVTNNAIGNGATRTTWPAIRDYMNSVCGTAIQ